MCCGSPQQGRSIQDTTWVWNAWLHKCFVWEHVQKEALCRKPGKTDTDMVCGVVRAELIAGEESKAH